MVTFQDIEAARGWIAGAVYDSPCPLSIPLSEITGMEIFCKLDNLQRTGSFKERGARNALAQLSADQKKTRRDRGLGWQSRPGAGLSGKIAWYSGHCGHAKIRAAD